MSTNSLSRGSDLEPKSNSTLIAIMSILTTFSDKYTILQVT